MLWLGRLGAKTFNVRRQALFGWCLFPLQCVILAYSFALANKVLLVFPCLQVAWGLTIEQFHHVFWFIRERCALKRFTHLFFSAAAHFGPHVSPAQSSMLWVDKTFGDCSPLPVHNTGLEWDHTDNCPWWCLDHGLPTPKEGYIWTSRSPSEKDRGRGPSSKRQNRSSGAATVTLYKSSEFQGLWLFGWWKLWKCYSLHHAVWWHILQTGVGWLGKLSQNRRWPDPDVFGSHFAAERGCRVYEWAQQRAMLCGKTPWGIVLGGK